MNVLYIGGTGEISYSCVQRSVEAGHEVTVFNRGRSDEPLPAGVRCIAGDVNDAGACAALAGGGFDVVCQFIAYDLAAVQRDVAIFSGRCAQYVFISTASAYQKPPEHYMITERTPLANSYWAYSRAKIAMEAYLREQHAAGRLNVTIVRPAHTHRRRFPGGLAGGDEWAWRIVNGKPIVVHGDGSSLWTLTYSTDFAVPFVNLLGKREAIGEDFHITRHMLSYTWNDIFAEVGRALGTETRIVHVASDTLVQYNADWAGPVLGDKAWSVMYDNSKVKSVAGEFECTMDLAASIRAAAEHYRRRAAAHRPDAALHALIDRIIAEQQGLGV